MLTKTVPKPLPAGSEWSFEAIDEYDELVQDAFLSRHGFRSAHSYFLIRNGKIYDSKCRFPYPMSLSHL